MRKALMPFVLVVACLCLLLPASATAASLSFTFDSPDFQWFFGQDLPTAPGAGFTNSWSGSGGNPGGQITGTDTMAENGCPADPCHLATFVYCPGLGCGPPGNGLPGKYGGSFSLDFNSSVTPVFDLLLALVSPSADLVTSVAVPGTGWQHLSIPLTEANWEYCVDTCAPASAAQMKCTLAEVDDFTIVADLDSPSGTGETYGVDNVLLTDGPTPGGCPPAAPPPAAPPPSAASTGQRAAAQKKCKKKHSKKARKKCQKKAKRLPV